MDMERIDARETVIHRGGCHCGRVRFEARGNQVLSTIQCNCSICDKVGYVHWIVPGDRFQLLQGKDALTEYRFNTGTAKHYFCKHCGVKSFYVPRSHPDSYSVNVRCLDPGSFAVEKPQLFDGQNWERNISQLASSSPQNPD
ncbi:MAG: GFA family protein [Cyanophyceae cyanobacterium]